jgi:C4-type Zn-finger protein
MTNIVNMDNRKENYMSYLHCHSCNWRQDDFYSVDGYNPAKYLKSWMKSLCEDDLDKQFTD